MSDNYISNFVRFSKSEILSASPKVVLLGCLLLLSGCVSTAKIGSSVTCRGVEVFTSLNILSKDIEIKSQNLTPWIQYHKDEDKFVLIGFYANQYYALEFTYNESEGFIWKDDLIYLPSEVENLVRSLDVPIVYEDEEGDGKCSFDSVPEFLKKNRSIQ